MTNKSKPFMCELCATSFTLKQNYNRHFKRKHGGKNVVKCLNKSEEQPEPQPSCSTAGSTTSPQKKQPSCSTKSSYKRMQRMLQNSSKLLAEKEDKLMRLKKAISLLLGDDDQVALSFIFEKLHGKIALMQERWPFLKPVNKRQVKNYDTVVKRPMDLQTIGKNVEAHRYHSRAEFMADIELIVYNYQQYNGSESRASKNATTLINYARSQLEGFTEHCRQLEQNICKVQEPAITGAVHPILNNDIFDIQTEVKMEPPEIAADNSMVLDRNYDPSGNGSGAAASSNEDQEFLPLDAEDRDVCMSQIPPIVAGGHDNVGIDHDLAISEGDKENNGAVTVKNEPLSVDEMMAENVYASSAGDCESSTKFLLDIGKEEIQDDDETSHSDD